MGDGINIQLIYFGVKTDQRNRSLSSLFQLDITKDYTIQLVISTIKSIRNHHIQVAGRQVKHKYHIG